MAHRELDLHERRAIEDTLNAKMSVREIAVEIECLSYRTPVEVFESDLMALRNRLEQKVKSGTALQGEFTAGPRVRHRPIQVRFVSTRVTFGHRYSSNSASKP